MATRKEIAKAFKAAQRILWDGRSRGGTGFEYICHALADLHYMPGAQQARSIVELRFAYPFGPGTTIYGWLSEVARIPSEQLTVLNVQAYKHRWLDSVIKEFSE